MASTPNLISGQTIKSWLVGTACGIALTVGLVTGTGHRQLSSHTTGHPATTIQQPAISSETGDVPPPIDEYQQTRRNRTFAQATATVEGRTIPPPIDGFRSANMWPSTAGNQVDITGGPPQPLNNGSTKY